MCKILNANGADVLHVAASERGMLQHGYSSLGSMAGQMTPHRLGTMYTLLEKFMEEDMI